MSITRIKSYGLSDGAVTTEKISNNVSLGVKISNIQIANSAYSLIDDTAVALGGGYIVITGAGFAAGCQVIVGASTATSTTFVNSTTLRAQVGAADAGTKIVYVVNTDGGTAIRVNGLTYSATPTWVTGSTLEGAVDQSISIQLDASLATSYQLQTGSSLPAGLSLAANGLLSGTVTGIQAETTYSFTIEAIDAENQESPRSFSITITLGDEYFYATALLLNGDGTNGANNNVFLDSSNNNFAITRNGNVNQGTFSPFSATDGRWSNYFDGSGDYLSVAQNSAFNFGTGAFTVEGWFYFWGSFGSVYNGLVNLGNGAQGNGPYTGWGLITGGTGTEIRWYRYDGATETQYIGNFSFQVGTWHHIVACRNSSSNLAVFVNGTRVVSTTSSISYNNINGDPLHIGYRNDGVSGVTHAKIYSSNIRIVAGSTVYDPTQTTITVPTSPLTAIANTSLLTCQSNRFKDNSTNDFTITRNGDVKVTPFGPFRPTDPYSTSVNGGSGYFDGSGDYLVAVGAGTSGSAFGSGDFTIEFWTYILANGGTWTGFFDPRTHNTSTTPVILLDSLNRLDLYVGAGVVIIGNVIPFRSWNHVVLSRSGSSTKLFLNGVQQGSTYNDTNNYVSRSDPFIGCLQDSGTPAYPLTGYISNLRVVKGTALYTSNFTPPTTPLTAITNTSLLLNFTNGGIIDYTGKNNLETVGNAQISTSVKKYGTGSMAFDGTNDYILIDATQDLEFGSGDFTIEFWYYPTSTGRQALYHGSFGTDWSIGIDYSSTSTNQKIGIWASSNGSSWNLISADGGGNGIGITTVTQNAWNHIAYVRNGTTWMLFVNGNRDLNLTGISGSIVNRATSRKVIGVWWSADVIGDTTGFIDDLRITKGFARYTANFTPPTSAHKLR